MLRLFLTLMIAFLAETVMAISCPDASNFANIGFTEPTEINWYDYMFIAVPGDAIELDDASWQVQALYAPVDPGQSEIDEAYKHKIVADVLKARTAITPKSELAVDNKCFYQANSYMHIMFVATLDTSAQPLSET